MARQKSSSATDGALIILLLVILAVILVTPIAMLSGFIYCKIRALLLQKKIPKNISAYWLDNESKASFKRGFSEFKELSNAIAAEKRRGEDEGISVNQDGNFSARSNLGKELRANIENLNKKLHPKELWLDYTRSLPLSNWLSDHEAFNSYNIKASKFWWGFVAWFFAMLIYRDSSSGIAAKETLLSYWSLAMFYFDNVQGKIPLTPSHFQALGIVTGVSLIGYFLRSKFIKKKPVYFCQKPELVTLKNVDMY